jgi:putative hemolysin
VDTATILELGLVVLLIGLSAFFSGSEASLFSLGLYRVRRLKTDAPRSFAAAQRLLREPTRLISTLLIGNELVNAAIGIIGSSIVYKYARGKVEAEYLPFLAVASVLPFILVFGEIIPKTLGVKNPEKLAGRFAVPLEWFSTFTTPLRDTLSWISERLLAATGGPRSTLGVSEDVFRSMVDTGAEEGVLEPSEQRLIHNVFRLDDIRVSQVMTPAQKISVLREDMTLAEVLDRFEADRYSRFPVMNTAGTKVAGVLYVKDLIGEPSAGSKKGWTSYLRAPLVVDPATNCLELFVRFRAMRTHFGVVEAAGSTQPAGIVTLDDVLRVVFGELKDEQDGEEAAPSKR